MESACPTVVCLCLTLGLVYLVLVVGRFTLCDSELDGGGSGSGSGSNARTITGLERVEQALEFGQSPPPLASTTPLNSEDDVESNLVGSPLWFRSRLLWLGGGELPEEAARRVNAGGSGDEYRGLVASLDRPRKCVRCVSVARALGAGADRG